MTAKDPLSEKILALELKMSEYFEQDSIIILKRRVLLKYLYLIGALKVSKERKRNIGENCSFF